MVPPPLFPRKIVLFLETLIIDVLVSLQYLNQLVEWPTSKPG
jgi:hypothetical protein